MRWQVGTIRLAEAGSIQYGEGNWHFTLFLCRGRGRQPLSACNGDAPCIVVLHSNMLPCVSFPQNDLWNTINLEGIDPVEGTWEHCGQPVLAWPQPAFQHSGTFSMAAPWSIPVSCWASEHCTRETMGWLGAAGSCKGSATQLGWAARDSTSDRGFPGSTKSPKVSLLPCSVNRLFGLKASH